MPIRTPRGRSAAYRALWQWPLRSPARLGLTAIFLLALVVAAAGLGAYIYFVESERTDTEVKAKVFAVEADAIDEIRVTAKGETSLLRKSDGSWKMIEPLATELLERKALDMVLAAATYEDYAFNPMKEQAEGDVATADASATADGAAAD